MSDSPKNMVFLGGRYGYNVILVGLLPLEKATMTDADNCRRKFIRFTTNTLVWWSKDWESEPIALLDISAGGMLCEFPCTLSLDSKVNLHFEFPNHEGMIFCRGKVVHCRPTEGKLFLVGLEIMELEGMNQVEFVKKVKAGILQNQA